MGWIPEHQRTTGWYLFNKLFRVRINPQHDRTADDIKFYGTPTTGNEDYDRELDKAEHVVMWNIAKIESHFASGYPVKFVDRKDCEEVYRLINNHLTFMHGMFGNTENTRDDPDTMSDLVRLDQFADATFQHARYGLRDNLQHAGYARRAMAKDRFAQLASRVRSRASGQEEKLPGGSSVGREYGTHEELARTPPPTGDQFLIPDPVPEDPTLPKRVSLANLFEERRQNGLRWK